MSSFVHLILFEASCTQSDGEKNEHNTKHYNKVVGNNSSYSALVDSSRHSSKIM